MASVAVYVHDLRASGVVRNAVAIAERLAGDRPTTLVAGHRLGLLTDVAGRGVRTLALSDYAPLGGRLRDAARLRRYLRRERPTVLLSAGNFGHPTVWLATRGLRPTPARVYRISNEIERPGGLRTALRAQRLAVLIRDATRIVVVGDAIGGTRLMADALSSGRAVVIRNGVDTTRADALGRSPAPHPWLLEDIPVVLGIGRLHLQKNLSLLVEAFARLRSRPLRLIILGNGSRAERRRLLDLAAARGVSSDVLLPGETDNVFPWLSRAAVFALPSRWEGSSVALLEALAAGVPVVANRSAGDARVVLNDGKYGVLSEDDPVLFAEALARQLGPDPVLPGRRAADYPISAALDAYADVVSLAAAERLEESPDGSARQLIEQSAATRV